LRLPFAKMGRSALAVQDGLLRLDLGGELILCAGEAFSFTAHW
jgi:hypothetical protein